MEPGNTSIREAESLREEPLLVGEMVGSYRVVSLLGRGGIGSVYLAEHPLIGAQVAIKVLHLEYSHMPGMGERFVREARAANLVPSPYVVRVHDFGQLNDGRQYAAMDYLSGLPLNKLLETQGALRPARAVRLLIQAASGLAAAHRVGVVHRDIKPDNLFLLTGGGSESVRIVDFGIAKLTEKTADAGQTVVGTLLGTPAYCAPEQAAAGSVGPAVDVYALATVGFEILAGAPLFPGNNVFEILADKIRCQDIQLEGRLDVPPPLRNLLERMLMREPSERPTMEDVERTLRCLEAEIEGRRSQPELPALDVNAVVAQDSTAPQGVSTTQGYQLAAADAAATGTAMPLVASTRTEAREHRASWAPETPGSERLKLVKTPHVDIRSNIPTRHGLPTPPTPATPAGVQLPIAQPATPSASDTAARRRLPVPMVVAGLVIVAALVVAAALPTVWNSTTGPSRAVELSPSATASAAPFMDGMTPPMSSAYSVASDERAPRGPVTAPRSAAAHSKKGPPRKPPVVHHPPTEPVASSGAGLKNTGPPATRDPSSSWGF